jgi:hypothetical protein
MDKTNITKANKTIEYKIDSIKVINHAEKHFSKCGLKSSDIKNGHCKIGINIHIDPNKSLIAIPMKVTVFSDGKAKHELFRTEAIYTFKIKKFKAQFNTNEQGVSNIPDAFMRTLIGTALGGMRGIMVASTTIAEYKNIILPLIETSQILENVKDAQSKMKPTTNPLVG